MTDNRHNGHPVEQPTTLPPLPILAMEELIGVQLVALAIAGRSKTTMALARRYLTDHDAAVAARAALALLDANRTLRSADSKDRLTQRLSDLNDSVKFQEGHRHVFKRRR